MSHELIITSVRKGLDGGSGYQVVLQTRGIKPAIVERLQIRSGYSHPYSHGDHRNPIVFIHRIERVANETLHVLARICDAGSDHTGRSNFLAHLVSLEDGEARKKVAGPADVTQRLAFRTFWNEPPKEASPPIVIGGKGEPGPCHAWQAAGLDPGIAGDLAEAAASGSEVRLIVRERDDVLALFADALALVSPPKRWDVTFNTCEIEPFDAIWRAIREDLPQSKSIRGSTGVIDLTLAGQKGSNGIYARFARGEAVQLPWQSVTTDGKKLTTNPTRDNSNSKTRGRNTPEIESQSTTSPLLRRTTPNSSHGYLDEQINSPAGVDYAPSRSVLSWHLLSLAALFLFVVLFISLFVVVQVNPEVHRTVASLFGGGVIDSVPSPKPHSVEENFEMGIAAQEDRERQKKQAEEESKKKKQAEEAQKALEDKEAREKKETHDKEMSLKKQIAAFKTIQKMPSVIEKNLPLNNNVDFGKDLNPVDLGPLESEDLIDLSFDLAVPKEEISGSPFKASVDRIEKEKFSWIIRTPADPTLDKDKPPNPIDLASLTVIDGRLMLKPSSKEIIQNRRFSLLRRSVLVVSAKDPEKPDKANTVQKAIQLVRPVFLPDTREILPVTKGSSLETITLDYPKSITVESEPNGKLPHFPLLGTTFKYVVAFDYSTDGSEKPVSHSRDLNSNPFCELLICQEPDPAQIGLEFTISPQQSTVSIKRISHGPGQNKYSIDELKPYVLDSDKDFEIFRKKEMAKTKNEVSRLGDLTINKFQKKDVDSSGILLKQNKDDINAFFNRTAGSPKSIEEWSKECAELLVAFQKQNDSSDFSERWKKTYSKPLKDWYADYEKRKIEGYNKRREFWTPLRTPVRITFSRITSDAFDASGVKYLVDLAVPNDNSQKNEQPTSRSDVQ